VRTEHRRRRSDLGRGATAARARSVSAVASQLLRMAAELRGASQIDTSLQAVTDAAVQLTRSFQGTLRLLDESGKRLLLSARTGPPMHGRGSGRFMLGEGFIGWVVARRSPAYTNRPERDPRFVVREGQSWMPGALMAVPLSALGQCIGVLSVTRRERGRPYRDADLRLLELAAELSSPYLEIARLKRLSETDPLTLLRNRRHLDQCLPQVIAAARLGRRPLCLAMLDVDHFKLVNDRHGHDVGDEVLVELAERVRSSCRASDIVARWGGEEIVILLPDAKLRQAAVIAERVRAAIERVPIGTAAGPISVSASLGVARLTAADDDAGQSLQRRADGALYAAKRLGRNRVERA
jgi:diguanylate cyclase (GGDEF)-like protein